jgi:hypothetical protein
VIAVERAHLAVLERVHDGLESDPSIDPPEGQVRLVEAVGGWRVRCRVGGGVCLSVYIQFVRMRDSRPARASVEDRARTEGVWGGGTCQHQHSLL